MPALNRHLTLAETGWDTPPAFPALGREEVHIWRIPLGEKLDPAAYEKYLSADEIARRDRFRFARDRDNFTGTRGRVRELLAGYLGVSPGELTFGYAAAGKPFLRDSPGLCFNVSHAGDWALAAVSRDLEIGVDVEFTDRSFKVGDLVERFFSRMEVPVIMGLPEGERHGAFYRAWTRKEAVIKARGDGLQLPLDQFGVSILAGEVPRVLHTDWALGEAGRWQVRSFMVAEKYPGAVAWVGGPRVVRFFDSGGAAGAGAVI